jgi:hypothetical protein
MQYGIPSLKITRLTIELVPSTCWYSNVRSNVTAEVWDRLRRHTYAQADHRCEICGSRGKEHPVECHEVWQYNNRSNLQKLIRLIALCPNCHEVKHIGFANTQGRGDFAQQHLAKVNSWTVEQTEAYVQYCFKVWQQRSQHEWRLDISYLEQFGISANAKCDRSLQTSGEKPILKYRKAVMSSSSLPINSPADSSDQALQPALFATEPVTTYQTDWTDSALPDPTWQQLEPLAAGGSKQPSTLPPAPTSASITETRTSSVSATPALQQLSQVEIAQRQASMSLENFRTWYRCAQILNQSEAALDRIVAIKDSFLAGTPPDGNALSTMHEDILDALRLWYRAARAVQKQPTYLARITRLAKELKTGKFLTEQALTCMQQDIKQYQQQVNAAAVD